MTTSKERERKYQGLRGHYGDKTFRGDKRLDFRTTAMATTPEYTLAGDIKQVGKTMSLLDKLDRLTATRDIKKTRAILSMKSDSKITKPREERIAEMATRYGGVIPHNYVRYGFMVAKHPERHTPTRPNSSKGKIGKTDFVGFDAFNKGFVKMEKSLLLLTRDRVLGKALSGQLNAIKSKVTTTVSK